MTECDYESRFLDQLIENYEGGSWKAHVRKCHESYMESLREADIAQWEIEQL